MSLLCVAVLAALQGFTEALPVSRSGHEVLARIWMDAPDGQALEGFLHLGTALALAAVARRRLAGAVLDGGRALIRPQAFAASGHAHDARLLLLASAVSLVASALVAPRIELWSESPTATGVGLCLTGLALASTTQIPRAVTPGKPRLGPSFGGAIAVGLAHGLAAFPGASRVGVALTLLLWLGVRPGRAVDLAFLLTVPSLLVGFAQAALAHAGAGAGGGGIAGTGASAGTLALGLVLAFVSAGLASEIVRSLAERRRVAALALWVIPLGLATIAYAHALPPSSS
jgi:undecaprenyl-diphosphatase